MRLKNIVRNGLIVLTCVGASSSIINYGSLYNNMQQHPEVKEFYQEKYTPEIFSGEYYKLKPEIREIIDNNQRYAAIGFSSLFIIASSLTTLILTREEKSKDV